MIRNNDAVSSIRHADMFPSGNNSESNLTECPDRALGRDISKQHLSGNLYLVYSRILGLLLYHPEVCLNGIFNIFNSFLNGVALTMAPWESRTMCIETIFTFVYDNRVFHFFNLPQVLLHVKNRHQERNEKIQDAVHRYVYRQREGAVYLNMQFTSISRVLREKAQC